jgi:hypothetical protein
MDYFENNPYIGPSIADFRRFLLKCNPRPNFKHYILACGTVIREDYLDTLTLINVDPRYLRSVNEIKNTRIDNIIYSKILTIMSKINSVYLNASAVPTGEKIWLVSLTGDDKPLNISVLAPGATVEESCPFAISAFRADHAIPIVYAVLEPYNSTDGILYKMEWVYGRPDTLHWPDN